MRVVFILSAVFILSYSYASDSIEIEKLKVEIVTLNNQLDSIKNHQIGLDVSRFYSNSEEKNKFQVFEFFLPSIIALIVGVMALIGTMRAGKLQRKSSEKQLKEQLEQSQKTVEAQINSAKVTLEMQITSAKEIADKQIDSTAATAELNFRQNVLSINRQNWINTLRDIVSEILASVSYLKSTKKLTHEEMRNLEQMIQKAELMVNPEKDEEFITALIQLQLSLLESIDKEIEEYYFYDKMEILKDKTKIILKTEWERVKRGE